MSLERKEASLPQPSTAQTLLSWILTPIHIFFFLLILIGYHIPLVITRHIFGLAAFDWLLATLCLAHITNIRLAGTRCDIRLRDDIPTDRPLLLISNHQAMYDIPFIMWHLRRFRPRFIAKIELKGLLPSISFSLRNGGHLIINRSDPQSAVSAISEYGKEMERTQGTICIFPEGTRARNGVMKPFKPRGCITLLETMPSALVIPIAIDGSWKVVRNKLFPVPFGVRFLFHVLDPIEPKGLTPEEVVEQCEVRIRKEIGQ